jgi:hypothetical protein
VGAHALTEYTRVTADSGAGLPTSLRDRVRFLDEQWRCQRTSLQTRRRAKSWTAAEIPLEKLMRQNKPYRRLAAARAHCQPWWLWDGGHLGGASRGGSVQEAPGCPPQRSLDGRLPKHRERLFGRRLVLVAWPPERLFTISGETRQPVQKHRLTDLVLRHSSGFLCAPGCSRQQPGSPMHHIITETVPATLILLLTIQFSNIKHHHEARLRNGR